MWSYETNLQWTGGEIGVERTTSRPDITICPPAEFGGKEDTWNPELMLVAAIESCMLLTSLSVAGRQNIAFTGYTSKAVGRMAKTPEGLRFQDVVVDVALTVPTGTDEAKAARVVKTAEKYCPVSNAVNFPVTVNVHVQIG